MRIAHVALAVAGLGACQNKSTEDRTASTSDTTVIAAPMATSATAGTATSAAPARSASSCNATTIAADGVGPIRIGVTVDSLKKLCDVVRDTTQLGGEGMMERRLTISVTPATLDAEIVNGRVWRLDISSPAFRTVDSLGVGSPLAALLRRQEPKPAAGEGIVVVMLRDHCGMSFVLSGGYTSGVFRKWTGDELSKLPSSTTVERVLVFGCPKKGA